MQRGFWVGRAGTESLGGADGSRKELLPVPGICSLSSLNPPIPTPPPGPRRGPAVSTSQPRRGASLWEASILTPRGAPKTLKPSPGRREGKGGSRSAGRWVPPPCRVPLRPPQPAAPFLMHI